MFSEALSNGANWWYEFKLFIEHAVAISHDAVHVVAGVVLQLLFALLARKPVSAWTPWLFVLSLTLINEAVDLHVEQWPNPGMQYGEGLKDAFLTMFLPTILLASARSPANLFRRPTG